MIKTEKNKKTRKQVLTVSTLQQFKELYFPSMSASEKRKEEDEDNYGDMIAMSILDGIKKDLSILRK